MNRALTYTAGIVGLAIGLVANSALAVTSAVGPYYATPSWDQTLPVATRFIVLTNMGSAAVLDRETGLVWEQSPSTASFNWFFASAHCVGLSNGGRKGWRLPTIQDLASLTDTTTSNPNLPSGHPFSVAPFSVYWSATTQAGAANAAYFMFFDFDLQGVAAKSTPNLAWCVRGGQGSDAQ